MRVGELAHRFSRRLPVSDCRNYDRSKRFELYLHTCRLVTQLLDDQMMTLLRVRRRRHIWTQPLDLGGTLVDGRTIIS